MPRRRGGLAARLLVAVAGGALIGATLVAGPQAGAARGRLVQTAPRVSASTATSPGWQVMKSYKTSDLLSVSCPSVSTCVAVGRIGDDSGFIVATTDGGSTWTEQTIPAGTPGIQVVTCPAVGTCYAVSGGITQGSVLSTKDGGKTWSSYAEPSGETGVLSVTCGTSTHCLVSDRLDALGGPKLLITSNGGQSWTTITDTIGAGNVTCATVNHCMSVDGTVIAVTSDSGFLWSPVARPSTPTLPTRASCWTPTDCVVVTADSPGYGTAFLTTDGGASWNASALPAKLPSFADVDCNSTTMCTAVGSGGLDQGVVIIQSVDGGRTWASEAPPSTSRTLSLGGVSCVVGGSCTAVGEGTNGGAIVVKGPLPIAPAITTSGLPGATAGFAYSTQLSASGGISPYTWSVGSGTLPSGMSLSKTGRLAGIPTSEGTRQFTVAVTGGNGLSSSVPLSLTVNPDSAPGCSSTSVGSASFPGGYWLATATGAAFSCGDAAFYGSLATVGVTPAKPIVGIAATPDDGGYWLVASDGGIFAFGDAQFFGSMGGKPLNEPVVGIAASAKGGYYEVASDGGVFAFGPGATFHGSMGGQPLNKPVVGMTVTSGGGYFEVASDGGVFAFGPGATFHGSMGGQPLNKPVVGMTTTPSGGYFEVASDGGVFAFGAPFHGSTGCLSLVQPIVAIQASSDTSSVGAGTACGFAVPQEAGGYQFVAADGGVFSFGNAVFAGSLGGQGVTDVVGMADA